MGILLSYSLTAYNLLSHRQIIIMKIFILLIAVAATLAVELRSEDLTVELENGALFNIFEIIGKLIEIGIPVACGTDVADLLDMLNLPAEIMGLIELGKSIVCRGM